MKMVKEKRMLKEESSSSGEDDLNGTDVVLIQNICTLILIIFVIPLEFLLFIRLCT